MLNPPDNVAYSGDSRPSMGKQQTSSRRLVDFESEQLLSMEEIRENVRLTASRLLNDSDMSDSEDDSDYYDQDQLPHVEDARTYAGRLLKNPSVRALPDPRKSVRKLMGVQRALRSMKDSSADNAFKSSMAEMSMDLDMHEIVPTRKRIPWHRVGCVIGVVVVATIVTLLVTSLTSSSGTDESPFPISSSPRMHAAVDLINKHGISDIRSLKTPGTPQNMAATWMADTDPMNYDVDGDESRFMQRYTMAVFYYAMNGPAWDHQVKFMSDVEECSWNEKNPTEDDEDTYAVGVTCNSYLQVETLLLPGNKLQGSLPSELERLTALDFVSLKHNNITGSIPDSFQALTGLEYFDLHSNQLTGTLPSWLGDSMKNLRALNLSGNQLQGPLPSSMSNMVHLQTMALDDNNFSGDMASVVNSMTALKYLYMDGNQFDSKVDDSFLAELDELEQVDLGGNQLVGDDFPSHLFELENLRVLDLHDNELAGSLPDDISDASALEYLSLYGNNLSGSIPNSIDHLGSLTHLDLSSNQFSGNIPESIAFLDSLTYLFLSDNPFTQHVFPELLVGLVNLQELSMAMTALTGEIPLSLGILENLVLLDLSDNELTGEVPTSIWEIDTLKYVMLHRNQLDGRISEGLVQAENLDLLSIDKNSIMDDFTSVCEQISPSVLAADCGGKMQEVYCPCCTICCEDGNPECNDELVYGNLDGGWEQGFTRTAYDFGPDAIFEVDGVDDEGLEELAIGEIYDSVHEDEDEAAILEEQIGKDLDGAQEDGDDVYDTIKEDEAGVLEMQEGIEKDLEGQDNLEGQEGGNDLGGLEDLGGDIYDVDEDEVLIIEQEIEQELGGDLDDEEKAIVEEVIKDKLDAKKEDGDTLDTEEVVDENFDSDLNKESSFLEEQQDNAELYDELEGELGQAFEQLDGDKEDPDEDFSGALDELAVIEALIEEQQQLDSGGR